MLLEEGIAGLTLFEVLEFKVELATASVSSGLNREGTDCHKSITYADDNPTTIFAGMVEPRRDHEKIDSQQMGGCQNYGPFLGPIIIRHLTFRVPKKGP